MLEQFSEWFRRILGQPVAPTTPGEERRIWVRYPCDLETTFQPANIASGVRLQGRVNNISQGGISLIVESKFEIGALLSIELPCNGEERPATAVLAYILRATPRADGAWEYGCSFALELPEDDLAPFGALRQKADLMDQRSWVRFPCQARATYQRVRPKDAPHCPATIVDVSASGVGLVVTEPVDLGALLSLHLSTLSGGTQFPMMISVVRITTQKEGSWLLGCNFLRELSDKELRPLMK